MAEIILTNGLVATVDEADVPLLSLYRWEALPAYNAQREIRGHYAVRSEYCAGKRLRTYMHRQLLDAPSGVPVDHANGDGLDNRRANIRLSSASQNGANRRRPKGRLVGVCYRKGRYSARLEHMGISYHAYGNFDEEGAARAYDTLARYFFGEFAALNFPDLAREAA